MCAWVSAARIGAATLRFGVFRCGPRRSLRSRLALPRWLRNGHGREPRQLGCRGSRRCRMTARGLPAPAGSAPRTVAAAARTVLTRTRLVDRQRAALELGTVQVSDGLVGAVGHLHEAE